MTIARRLTLSTLRGAAHRIGATLEDCSGGRWRTYYVDIPIGRRFIANDATTLCVTWHDGDPVDRTAAIADALDRLTYGTRPATPEEIAEDLYNQGEEAP